MRYSATPLTFFALSAGLSSVALASPATVFYENDNPNVVLGQVVVATGQSPDAFQLVTVAEAFGSRDAILTGTADHVTCSSPRGGTQKLLDAIAQAEQSLMYMETDKVAEAYVAGQNAITCLNEPLPHDEAARLNFLAGIAAMQDGDKIGAWDAFRAAWILNPEVAWDPNYPNNAERVFKLAINEAKATEKVELTLTVPAPESGFWWNGRPVPHGTTKMMVDTGEQIVQWSLGDKVATYRFTVKEGLAPSIAIPATVPAEFPRWVSDDRARAHMDAILPLTLAEGADVMVAVGGGVWKTQVGWDEWEVLTPPTADIVVELPETLNLDLNPVSDSEAQEAAVASQVLEAEILSEQKKREPIQFTAPAFWTESPTWAKATAPALAILGTGLAIWARSNSSEIAEFESGITTALDYGDTNLAEDYRNGLATARQNTAIGWSLAGGALVGAAVTVGVGFEF